MKRSIIVLGTVILLLTASFSAQAATYQLAHQMAPSHPFQPSLELFVKEVAEKTNNRIQFNILSSSVIGGELEQASQMISGALAGGIISAVIFENFDPIGCFEDLPYLYKDTAHARRAIDGDVGKLMQDDLIGPQGLKVLSWGEFGFRHFTNHKRPLRSPEDMHGIKFRSGPNPMRLLMFEAFGASAVPIAFPELFTALQQGTVDGQESALPVIDSSKLYETQKYLSLTGHIFQSAGLMMNGALWKSFSSEDQTIMLEAAHKATVLQRELYDKLEETLLETLKKAGLEIIEVDKKLFADACVKPVWEGYFMKKFGARGQKYIDAAAKYTNE